MMRGATFARVLSMVAAACVACGCTVRVSDRCNTTDDCLGGVCVGGICQARGNGDATPPDVAIEAPAVDAMADGATDTPADTENADSESADAGSGDAAVGDAADAGDGHVVGRTVLSACPAWADWPMPSPQSSDIASDAPGNLPNPQAHSPCPPQVRGEAERAAAVHHGDRRARHSTSSMFGPRTRTPCRSSSPTGGLDRQSSS